MLMHKVDNFYFTEELVKVNCKHCRRTRL